MRGGLSPQERETARRAGEVARRAIRRLDILEWVTFGAAVVIAVVGGAAVAWLLAQPGGQAFRITWATASVLLFVVPGGIVILRMRRSERDRSRADERETAKGDNG